MLTFIHWLFAIYIFVECGICYDRMNRGDRFCRMAKYTVAILVAFVGLALCYILPVSWYQVIWLINDLGIALFLWPTTYARLTGGFKNRIGDTP